MNEYKISFNKDLKALEELDTTYISLIAANFGECKKQIKEMYPDCRNIFPYKVTILNSHEK